MRARSQDGRIQAGEWGSWNSRHGSRWKDDDADQLHKTGDPEAESAHPVRTPAEPDKMADSAAALKARDKEVTKNGGSSALPPPSQHLSSTHFFPEFLSQRLSRTLSPWNGRMSIHTSLLVLVAFIGSQG